MKELLVTQPSLPDLKRLLPYLDQIWLSKHLTNGGKFHKELEQELVKKLEVNNISLFCNATIALITSLKALGIKGEVITTPYSFVATAHSLLWNDIKPIFVDINPRTLNIDPQKIEEAITPQTSAILPVHVYGYPCDVDAIAAIARRHNLKIIYDAAHAFGVNGRSGSLLNQGDISVLSFHATKVFNTFEGGAVIANNSKMKSYVDNLKNFGFYDEVTVTDIGINGKMSEFPAALGLLQLERIDEEINKRGTIDQYYREKLSGLEGVRCHIISDDFSSNYGYFPIFVEDNFPISRDQLYLKLKDSKIYSRRYFYPLISDFSMYKDFPSARPELLPSAHWAASHVLCLPIFSDMKISDAERVVNILKSCFLSS